MRYLFVHQSFPAQYIHLLRYLVQQGGNEIVFITTCQTDILPEVRRVLYTPPPLPSSAVHPAVRELDHAVRRAEAVAQVAQSLKSLGYVPDIILGHHGWGELLNLGDVFPHVPVLGYFEFYYHIDGLDVGFDPEFPLSDLAPSLVRCKNAINLQALTLPGVGQTPTVFQKKTYPDWAQPKLSLVREGVDLAQCFPDKTAKQRVLNIGDVQIQPYERLVTYVARDMEPYRGFHSFMRSLPRILDARPDVRVVLVGGDGISYGHRPVEGGSWRDAMLRELKGQLDLERIHFVGWRSHSELVHILQRSDAHVYLTYPFVLSWSLREAMAAGCSIVASDTAPVREFLTDGENARLVPFLQPDSIADGVLELLEDRALAQTFGRRARQSACTHFDLHDYLQQYKALIDDNVCRGCNPLV